MATLTPTEHRVVEPEVADVKEERLVSLIPEREMTQPQQVRPIAEYAAAQPEKRPTPAATNRATTVALQVGVPILVASALILAGLMRPRIEHGLRRLVEKAADMHVPVLLPVAIAESVREVINSRRAFAETTADPDAVG
ncbi:MAG TPA: hypothetical protein VFU88_22235 [Ktedonobacterales bacterium]|nr:hypothetical protein [Ktedonobacterales bacterium]